MSFEKRAVISQIELLGNLNIRVRLIKQTVIDGQITNHDYHRTAELPAGCDEDTMRAHFAAVDADLNAMNFPTAPGVWEMVFKTVAAHWTEEHRLQYQAAKAEAEAAAAAQAEKDAAARTAAEEAERAKFQAAVDAALAARQGQA